jgi:hypothetical protein
MNPGNPNAKQRVRLQPFRFKIAISHLQRAVELPPDSVGTFAMMPG